MNREKQFVYKTTLSKTYGLTPAMINELGEPDKFCDNPHWLSGPPAGLYSIQRVESWVGANQERVDRARESRVRRSAAAKAVQEEKRMERLRDAEAWASTVAIEVAPLPATLLEDARRIHRNLSERGLRAYVRHRLTNYESLLAQIRRHEFQTELYSILRERVDAAVEQALGEGAWDAHLQTSA